MNILFTLQDGAVGGTERRVVAIAERLISFGHDVVVLIPNGGSIKKYLVEANIPVEEVYFARMRKTKNILYYFWWIIAVFITILSTARVIKKRKIDVVYTNQIAQIQPALAGKLMFKKVIWHLIDLHNPAMLDVLFSPFLAACSDKVVSSCEKRVTQLRSRVVFSFPNVEIVRAPVNCNKFFPKDNERLRRDFCVSDDGALVGMACNINYNKGVINFVHACAIISKNNPKIKFVIFGGSIPTQVEYFNEVIALVESLGLQEKFTITGHRDDMPDAIAALDVFVLSSISEACPLVVLESMASGVPVVATAVGGVPELVLDKKRGRVIPAEDSKQLAYAVISSLEEKDVSEEMSRNALSWVRSTCDIDVIARQVEKICAEVI